MTPEAARRRAIGQILLLAAGFLVLVAISTTSVVLVNQARYDNYQVVHTVEVENQIGGLLLEIRRAESSARGYLLTSEPRFLSEHDAAIANILPDLEKLTTLTNDNPVQVEGTVKLVPAVRSRLAELARAIDFAKRNDLAGGIEMLRSAGPSAAVRSVSEVATECAPRKIGFLRCGRQRRIVPSYWHRS